MTALAVVALAALTFTAVTLVKGLHVGARTITRDHRDLRTADRFARDLAAVTADSTLRLEHPDCDVTR